MAGKLGMDRVVTKTQLEEQARVEAFKKQSFRKWKQGDVYAPRDLSGVEQKKWKNARRAPQNDAFDVLGINPINEYKVRQCFEGLTHGY
jgi:small subunit ribosomal protein S18